MRLSLSKFIYSPLFAFLICIISCNKSEIPKEEFVSPPFESIDVSYNEFEVDGSIEKTITMGHGTKILIPSEAFVDKDNHPITGKLQIRYREFHDAADIITAGVSMRYDSGGVTNHFQTAGMFEILGSQNGSPIFIKNGKSIEVKMASKIDGNTYNFYSQDTASKKWVYQGKSTSEENQENLKAMEGKIGPAMVQPIAPALYNPDKFVFDVKINTKKYPELKDFHDIIWQYDGNNDSIDPEKNDWVFTEKWTNMDLQINDREKSIFWLTLSNNSKNFKTLVKAVFSDKKIVEAKKNFEKRNKDYQSYLTKKREEYKLLNNQYNFLRSFQISGFGLHNYDKIFNSRPEFLAAEFEFDQEVNTDIISVFLITGNFRVAIPHKKQDWSHFIYFPGEEGILVAILPGNKIAVNTDLRNETFSLGKKAPEKFTFRLKTINESITKVGDLRNALSKI